MPRNTGTPTSRLIGLFMGLNNSERTAVLDTLKAIQQGSRVQTAKPKVTPKVATTKAPARRAPKAPAAPAEV